MLARNRQLPHADFRLDGVGLVDDDEPPCRRGRIDGLGGGHLAARPGAEHALDRRECFFDLDVTHNCENRVVGHEILPVKRAQVVLRDALQRRGRAGARPPVVRDLRILVQAAPAGVDLPAITAALSGIEGVVDVHDLHVWTLTSDMEVLTAHVGVADGASSQAVLQRARTMLADDFHLSHATLQVETAGNHECDDMTW